MMSDKKAFDKMNERFSAACVKYNHQLYNCIRNEAFEQAASIRDDIKELIETASHILAPLCGKSVEVVRKTLQQLDEEIRNNR